ncbi:sigma-70 family RNA polymerase sigma factor [Candidatus Aerophobetes bacterium]|nr:sigma-70 family RNA polymerase sigma factor [Candidatus Aerophobetes bacterium]
MSISDEVLILKFKRGDKSSFRRLVEKYQSKVYSIVLAMIGDKNDADDLSQEIFIKVYKGLTQFNGRAKFFTWLYRITINTCINAQNTRKRKPETILMSYPVGEKENPLSTQLSQDTVRSPMEILENKELGMKIKLAIDSLSDGLREVFILREVEDLSYKELSKILQCPEGTIKSRLFRAREEMKKKLTPYLGE